MSYEFIHLIECSDCFGYSQIVGCAKTKKTALKLKKIEDKKVCNYKCWIKKRKLSL